MAERPPVYLNLAEASARYGVHVNTIRRRIASGKLTGYRMGRRKILVKADELDTALLEEIPTARPHSAA